ncbi:MAG TPA: glycosyltransferase family A protein [Noviherbaspirillum sp.]|uniref:glycosyltransferase family 2 protein n=1 Tax=Noviherbaspirillum sp. TaxID=1926288 RepID=UPI002B480FC1|nr:glycosyltransferase family A protein [Noviherbaspirillum sp.]HJV86018.1 glycosyltransferase family A protein [Noviherbaspirillum sp.]
MKPALSLILCTYQRTAELGRLFQSLAIQNFRDFEIIVVDQNADERVTPFLDKARRSGMAVKHLRHAHPNLSTARNIGIRAAQGEWVGFPDDDCWYEPDLLERLAPCFHCTDPLTGVMARWAERDEPARLPLRLTHGRSRMFRDRMAVSFMLFFNRKLFAHIGNFDSRLGVGQWFGAGEETDLVMRALHAGASITFFQDAVVHHPWKPAGSGPVARHEMRRRERGTGALYAKHELPMHVIARGLVAPLLRPLLSGTITREFTNGCVTALGRWEGMVQWQRRHQDNPARWGRHPDGHVM